MKDKPDVDITKIAKEDLPWDQLPDVVKETYKQKIKSETSQQKHQEFLYLHGALARPAILGLVHGQCIHEEVENLDQILADWKKATDVFRQIELKEQGIADNNLPLDIEPHTKLQEIQNNPLFKNTFSNSPIEFKMVEVDNMVAPQRHVSIDYVEQIMKRVSDDPSLEELIDICINPNQNVPEVKSLQQTQNMFTFSSPSTDFRFLGGHIKENLTLEDQKYCLGGGLPVNVIMLFVGYGGGSINVIRANNRLILNNGFHRVYALRKKGITKIPVVVQNIGNPDLDMVPSILGLSRDYLLKHTRPVLVKDFFVDELTTTFRLKNTIRSVQVQWGTNQSNMAV